MIISCGVAAYGVLGPVPFSELSAILKAVHQNCRCSEILYRPSSIWKICMSSCHPNVPPKTGAIWDRK